jgi:TPR repeat protein
MRVLIWVLAAIISAIPMRVWADEASLDRSCNAGNLDDCSRLGTYYITQRLQESDKAKYPGLFRKAERCYLKACDGGSALGCHQMAFLYLTARTMEVASHDELVSQFEKKACDGGNADGCESLAGNESGGVFGATKNPALALQHIQKAARIREVECDKSILEACGKLGYQYEKGSGVERNLDRALVLYKKACDDGKNYYSCEAVKRLTQQLGK